MHCEAPRQPEIDWDALWEQRKKEIAKKYREELKERARARNEIRREERREYRKAIIRKSQRKRRAEAREKGLCIQCCTGIPASGRKCLEKAREHSRKNAEKKRHSV
ncbi:MAG: hypothetical protein J6N53_07880 [Lachnospiraceae bacterium]|nr:hypothetical protein [Lachnospiraceae bacterium]MBP3295849.1 hypothetical protein [Lachnospiraceae bacterium]